MVEVGKLVWPESAGIPPQDHLGRFPQAEDAMGWLKLAEEKVMTKPSRKIPFMWATLLSLAESLDEEEQERGGAIRDAPEDAGQAGSRRSGLGRVALRPTPACRDVQSAHPTSLSRTSPTSG